MDSVIYLDSNDTSCCDMNYYNFLDYAFSKTDYFMLVYVNYYGKGYTKTMKEYMELLKPYIVKSRTNPSWPGTLKTNSENSRYKVVFYKNTTKAKEILKSVNSLWCWSRPKYPQDLAFFIGNQCWFYSVGHEKIAAIIHASKEDIDFVDVKRIASKKNAYIPTNSYFSEYDEKINS